MSVTSKIPNVVFLGLLVSLCLLSDQGFGHVVSAEQIVGTDPKVVLEVGTRGILPCRIQRSGYSVDWKRQLSSETELLVSLDLLFDVGERDGPGYEAGMFNITDDYSLVIKDVKVQDEGLYICAFIDYQTGKVFRNSTIVFVQAFPAEPFPVIQECIGKDVSSGACTLAIHQTFNLTCFVRGYYPDIDLFFLHGSEKVRSPEYEEWDDADGTKNKYIRVQVSISNEPYECVASSLPGIVGNKSVSVIVHGQDSPPTHSQGPHAAAIAVPVLMIVGICLSIAIIKCRVCRSMRHGFYRLVPGAASVKAPMGPVSKLELWTLVTKAKEGGDSKKLRKALSCLGHLSKTSASKLQEDDDFYESLCEWKSKTSSDPYQRKKLYSACSQVGMFDITRTLEDLVWDISYEVSKADIEHILWEIRDTRKICQLLRALQLATEAVNKASERGIREVINVARMTLLQWRFTGFQINPIVILSWKLDNLQYETNFFKINMSMKEEIDEEEMMLMCCHISEKHYMHLVNTIRHHQGEDLPHDIRKFVKENNASLFDTLEMLRDWVRDEESSNYDKVDKLLNAVNNPRQTHHTDAKWPPDDDLKIIASFLSPTSMEQLCFKLHIKSPPQEASQEKRFQALTEWRDNHASSKDLMEKHTELFNALREVKQGGLISRVKGNLVYKAELVDLAFHLFSQDILAFTEALGISAARLVAYRPKFQPSHMTQGTIGLVCKLFKSVERSHFLEIMKKIPYPNVFASVMLALEISYIEVCAIAANPANSQTLERTQASFTTSTSLPHEDDSFTATVEEKLISSGAKSTHLDESIEHQFQNDIFNETTTMLTSANQVEDHNQVSPESSAFLKHFKVWRARPRLSPFDCRLALANHLKIEEYYHQMSGFLRDLANDPDKGIMPFTFIHSILQTMDLNHREILGNLMSEASFKLVANSEYSACIPFNDYHDDWLEMKEDVIDFVYHWTNNWILEMILAKGEKGKEEEIAKKHKECNDKLVDNGFLDLAREIMISEQLPIDTSSFTRKS